MFKYRRFSACPIYQRDSQSFLTLADSHQSSPVRTLYASTTSVDQNQTGQNEQTDL